MNGQSNGKRFFMVLSVIAAFLVAAPASATEATQAAQAVSVAQAEAQEADVKLEKKKLRRIKETKPKPSKPAMDNIKANPAVLRSAACCKTQCADGTTCGNSCTIVDKLSECSAHIANYKFECGANQSLSCNGSKCSCN